MKARLGLLGIAVAVVGGTAAGLYAFSKPSPVIAQPVEPTTLQESVKAVEAIRAQPETTGAASREPRIIPITRDAVKNWREVQAAPKPVEVSGVKTKKEAARERAEHRRAERKARREAKRDHAHRRAEARRERGYQAYGQDEFSAFSFR